MRPSPHALPDRIPTLCDRRLIYDRPSFSRRLCSECRAMVEGLAAEQLDRQEAGEGAATPQLSYVAR